MTRVWGSIAVVSFSLVVLSAQNQEAHKPDSKATPAETAVQPASQLDSITEGTVTLRGQVVAYRAVAGTLTVGATDSQDETLGPDGKLLPESGEKAPDASKPDEAPPTARMFFTAYFKRDAPSETRPIIFLYNGGPGSSTMWLHMGAFGPKRVLTTDTKHDPGAPYRIVANEHCLLDASDLVFIDAPGTGFSRIMGKDKEKAFLGTDQDAHAFERFIRRFLTKFNRWNSPKYLLGESYGTPRSAAVSAMLHNVDLNGIVLLSVTLSFDNWGDSPRWNPGVEQPYALMLPTFAATAYYHHKLPQQPKSLEPLLNEVEKFAMGEYMTALLEGSQLSDARRHAIAEKLHQYTGLPVNYLLKANLRVTGGAFSKTLQDDEGVTTGRLDTRYRGPDYNRLSEEADYDPVSNAISAAYATAINHYLRTELSYGQNQTYKPVAYGDAAFNQWDARHQAPGGPPATATASGTNVLPDLAIAMKANPKMKILVAGGYYDWATPYFEGVYEMHHLPIPDELQANISYHYYESGHMVYLNEPVLKQFHDDVASFVRTTAMNQ
jgi:carboxypeptidase C (cathepsin A)